ncbi:MAG TPA: RDD family protein [Gaiellales bacterium]|jgi:uncharacterized RDD family membrane protein YckC|nr:RDD family protein [Gaiellales bacterium]
MSERIEIATPERVTVGYELAGVGSRMLAQIVDAGIIVVVYIALFFAAGGIAIASGILAAIVLVVVATFTPVGYFLLLEWLRRGSTPGKAALGLRVVRATGDPIGFTDSAVRNIVRIADFLPVAYLLGGVCALVSARGQRLGDLAAGTVVVRTGDGGVSTGTFADAVAEAGREAIPPDLIALAVAFRGRRRQLDEDVRRDLAARIAERIEPHHARPFGMGEEEFVIRAATRTLPGQAAS